MFSACFTCQVGGLNESLLNMSSNKKWVNLSFLCIGLLVTVVSFLLGSSLTASFDLEGRVSDLDSYLKVGSLALGGLCWLVLHKHPKSSGFTDEVFTELAKVTWPGREESVKGAIAVLIAVTIAGFSLGLVDWIWSSLVALII